MNEGADGCNLFVLYYEYITYIIADAIYYVLSIFGSYSSGGLEHETSKRSLLRICAIHFLHELHVMQLVRHSRNISTTQYVSCIWHIAV
jgi:hypothetical protein